MIPPLDRGAWRMLLDPPTDDRGHLDDVTVTEGRIVAGRGGGMIVSPGPDLDIGAECFGGESP